jgi:hypothetical protein
MLIYLGPFEIFYGYLGYFMTIWYIFVHLVRFSGFSTMYLEKSGNLGSAPCFPLSLAFNRGRLRRPVRHRIRAPHEVVHRKLYPCVLSAVVVHLHGELFCLSRHWGSLGGLLISIKFERFLRFFCHRNSVRHFWHIRIISNIFSDLQQKQFRQFLDQF